MKHELLAEDEALFEKMEAQYVSINEKTFFENIRYKQESEISGLNDLLVSEYENSDEIYVVRECYEEYVVGHGIGTDGAQETHVMSLSEALNLNLKDLGYIDRDLTLLDWLREGDYAYVKYNCNYDLTR